MRSGTSSITGNGGNQSPSTRSNTEAEGDEVRILECTGAPSASGHPPLGYVSLGALAPPDPPTRAGRIMHVRMYRRSRWTPESSLALVHFCLVRFVNRAHARVHGLGAGRGCARRGPGPMPQFIGLFFSHSKGENDAKGENGK